MKIAIVTLPFLNNYGGVLQNYALQKVLCKLGHDPVTFDVRIPQTSIWIFLCSWIKTLALWFVPHKRRPFAKLKGRQKRAPLVNHFITSWIKTSRQVDELNENLVTENKVAAIIVGSDQVWRPRYCRKIQDSFLDFAKDLNVRRIAYAASFGVDAWEYTDEQTNLCSVLIKKFDSVSVREMSGVALCKEKLGVDSENVLDPTLLLSKEDYCDICAKVPVCHEKILAAYLLCDNLENRMRCENIAKERNLKLKIFSADSQATLTIPEWLAMFRDAAYVVTDSFHGTVFSIIFGKEFKCIYNESRGKARFESLLNLYNSGRMEEMRRYSFDWLQKSLK